MKIPSRKGSNDLNYTELYNQIILYMRILQNVHGVLEVFAIITTYSQWKILWLDACQPLVSFTSFEQLRNYSEPIPEFETKLGLDSFEDAKKKDACILARKLK